MNALDQWPVWCVFLGVGLIVLASVVWGGKQKPPEGD